MVSREDKHAAAVRELSKRRKLYPRLVSEGRMTQAAADHEIEVMREIVEDYREPDLLRAPPSFATQRR